MCTKSRCQSFGTRQLLPCFEGGEITPVTHLQGHFQTSRAHLAMHMKLPLMLTFIDASMSSSRLRSPNVGRRRRRRTTTTTTTSTTTSTTTTTTTTTSTSTSTSTATPTTTMTNAEEHHTSLSCTSRDPLNTRRVSQYLPHLPQ